MLIHRVYKYRLYQGPGTGAELLRQLELCHRLYNKALWRRRGKYKFEVSAQVIVGHLQRSPNTLTLSAVRKHIGLQR